MIGLGIALAAVGTILAALVYGADFWEDGRRAPAQLEGQVQLLSRPTASVIAGRFRLITTQGQTTDFELKNSLLNGLNRALRNVTPPPTITVTFSPHLHNVYTVQVDGQLPLVQDAYEPGQPLQAWQRVPAYMLAALGLFGVLALLYAALTLVDWFWPVQTLLGLLVARIERTESSSDGFSVIVRPWQANRAGKQMQFDLGQTDFLATDGADYLEVNYTRFLRYVRRVRSLTLDELPLSAQAVLRGISGEAIRLSYAPGWRLRAFLYTDGLLALGLLSVTVAVGLLYLPFWDNAFQVEPVHYMLLVLLMILSFSASVYLLGRFRRKLQDVTGPKRIINGPVLSKWRVTGTSNDNRRLIVVADGGLAAGEAGIRKFDLSPTLFDQLQVGDIVEIEHTPRLRFICRLEVKGHQELTRSYGL